MILAVDIGNTNIKIGAWDNDKLVFVSRLQTNTLKTCDEYAVNLVDIFSLNNYNASQFDGAIISSVVPALSFTFKSAIQFVIRTKRVYIVSAGLKTGLNIKIENPATLGADMVCCAVAAVKYPMPCIIASMGTATAIFALDKNGAFVGGAVAPGVAISIEALAAKTAQLPHISLDSPGALIAANTVDCMKSGSIYGTACMLDGMLRRMKQELGEEKVTVIASGGIAPFIIEYCEEEIIFDDALVLEGLRIIYEKNNRLHQEETES